MIGGVFAAIGRGLVLAFDVAIAVDRAIDKIKPWLRKPPKAPPGTPLPFQAVRRINDIAHRAGHEHERTPRK